MTATLEGSKMDGAPREIPTCCVTGAVVGDGGACGDCDPCIMGNALVPASVKRLISEKNNLLNQVGELSKDRNKISEKAREWAGHYTQGSDGRNTFVMFANWVDEGCK